MKLFIKKFISSLQLLSPSYNQIYPIFYKILPSCDSKPKSKRLYEVVDFLA
jgi:hypothetical protein